MKPMLKIKFSDIKVVKTCQNCQAEAEFTADQLFADIDTLAGQSQEVYYYMNAACPFCGENQEFELSK
jgi:hypothetical protein